MNKLANVIAAIALVGTPAFAADMAVKAPAPITASGTPHWTGFYVGADSGYGWGARNSPLTYTLTNTFGSTPEMSTTGLNAKGGLEAELLVITGKPAYSCMVSRPIFKAPISGLVVPDCLPPRASVQRIWRTRH